MIFQSTLGGVRIKKDGCGNKNVFCFSNKKIILERRMTFGGPTVEPFICLRTRFGLQKKLSSLYNSGVSRYEAQFLGGFINFFYKYFRVIRNILAPWIFNDYS